MRPRTASSILQQMPIENTQEGATALVLRNEQGRAIRSVDEWFDAAPPKLGCAQWKDGRSAKELAKAWLREGTPAPPQELTRLFDSHPATRGLVVREAVAERRLRLDDFRGERRTADLWLLCRGGDGPVIATVEAKADEEFGPAIGPYYDSTCGTASKVPARIDALCSSIFGHGLDSETRPLRYQLLHGIAATLISASDYGADKAIFVVHEFHSATCRQAALLRNAGDWDQFLRVLKTTPYFIGPKEYPPQIDTVPFKLFGPIAVPGGEFVPTGIPLFLGYARTNLSEVGLDSAS